MEITRRWGASVAASVALGASILSVLGACSAPPPESRSPWAPEIAAAYERAQPGLAKDILQDGMITEEEYRQAVDAYVQCMNENGLEMEAIAVGPIFNFGVTGSGDLNADNVSYDTADAICRPQSIEDVEWLYVSLVQDPDRIPLPQRQIDCLKQGGFLEGDISWQEFQDAYLAFVQDGTILSIDFHDPDVQVCITNP